MKPLASRILVAVSPPRDENGVPHITAPSWAEALYGLGYMHAIDRPTQMLFARRGQRPRGELISDKPELLETDRFFGGRAVLHLDGNSTTRRQNLRPDRLLRRGQRRHEDRAARCPCGPPACHALEPASGAAHRQLLSFGGLVVGQQQNERICSNDPRPASRDKLRELFEPP